MSIKTKPAFNSESNPITPLFDYDNQIKADEEARHSELDYLMDKNEIDAIEQELEADRVRLEFMTLGDRACGCVDVIPVNEVFIGEEGTSVNLTERNQSLSNILKNYGAQSRSRGMAIALASPPADLEIINHYNSPGLAQSISSKGLKKSERLAIESKDLWNKAYGAKPMTDHGLSGKSVLFEANEEFRRFESKFAGPENRHGRDKEKKILIKQAKALGPQF